ncbi:MAG: Uma2 family endonuclease [Defluviitaleaceae bacterium]|nr:Uma2 family endonuclease [Defluviitaleaceae bacterium]
MIAYAVEMSQPKERHSQLTSFVFARLVPFLFEKDVLLKKEDKGLCYSFSTDIASKYSLIAANEVSSEDLDEFNAFVPDIMFFRDNPFQLSGNTEKVAGFPDLIVEVWSKSNLSAERTLKRETYSTGETTEHWYFTQNSNEVECWLGKNKLPPQNLQNVLVTQKGVNIDLRLLA